MASYRLAAVIIKNSSDDGFLVVKQTPPPPLPEEEYQQFVDSDLWDLPSTVLEPLTGDQRPQLAIQGADSVSDKVDIGGLDLVAGLDQVLVQLSLEAAAIGNWALLNYVEEPEFGPGPPVHTLFLLGTLDHKVEKFLGFFSYL